MAKTPGEKPNSINDTMTRMNRRMNVLLHEQAAERNRAVLDAVPDELRFWVMIDPLLAELNKEMTEARERHARLLKTNGEDDAMAAVAADMRDSAECAFETRLLELRRDEDAKARAMAMRRIVQLREESEEVEREKARSDKFWTEFARPKAAHAQQSKAADNFWMIAIGLMTLNNLVDRAYEDLSMMSDFGRASSKRRLAAS